MPPDYEPPKTKKKREISPDHPFLQRTREQRQEAARLGREARLRNLELKKNDKRDAREKALSELEPKAVQVLREHLEHTDERLRQAAAFKVLEWHWGKPTTTVEKKDTTQVEFTSSVLDAMKTEN